MSRNKVGDTKATKLLPYYDYGPVLSRNALFSFVVGGRGLGKTYGFKHWAIRDWIRSGAEFVYLRRYKTELTAKQTFFADIGHEFPDYEFRVEGNTAQARPAVPDGEKNELPWQTMGYFVSLSTALTKKSMAYPKVTKICFDEFIIERGHIRYLPDEVKAFLEFYSTVDRWKDKTRAIFLANSVSIYNPYFIEWSIEPKGSVWYRRKQGDIVVHLPDGDSFANAVYNTRFGKFIKDTEYAQYAVESEFKDANSLLIKAKPPSAEYYCRFETSMIFSVWIDYDNKNTIFYISEKQPTTKDSLFTIHSNRLRPGDLIVDKQHNVVKIITLAYKRAQVYFSTARVRSAFEELL